MTRLTLRAMTLGLVSSLALTAAAAAQPRLLATIGMLADPASRIAGDCVAVEALVGPGLDPHLYTPRPSDIAKLREADSVIALGLGLEGRLAEVLERSGARIIGDLVDPSLLLEEAGAPDPHLWMNAQLWSSTFAPLHDVLAELAPDCAPSLAENLRAESERAEALNAWIRASIETIPPEHRLLMTAHDAFNYYADAYGLESLALQGISTEAEVSIASVQNLAREANERQVQAVFVESTLNPRAVEALIEAAAALGHDLARGESLYSDALGEEGSGADTWPGMLVHNTRSIVTALGGTPAELPAAVAELLAAR